MSSSSSDNSATAITVLGTRMPFDIFSASYGILVAAGGILGYVKAQSVPSLAAGLTFGTLICAGSYLEATQDNFWLTYGASGLLGAMMLPRFLKSKKFMPSGLVATMSIAMFTRYTIRTYQMSQAPTNN